ncbi:MAG: 5-oxoprolinase subunit PxpB [Pseudonocardiales bacterium]|nr:5-oxoprolinase subunit PxpB [Actinomycetota bacterium]
MNLRLLPYGDRAVLVEVADPTVLLGLSETANDTPGVLETVPAARTLLVRFDPHVTSAAAIGAVLDAHRAHPARTPARRPIELRVHYDGADLTRVADEIGISVEELIGRHTAAEYTVAFCGFAPGFAYLSGLHPSLHVGRLAEPRTEVPTGSVGVAGEFTGVYPRSSPGGWRLLGRTAATLWDTAREQPALLTPGRRVRFRSA